ncbi:MAG TPA: hypothetical protein PLC55_17480 [Zoogloea sp.]|nr:hypothetical protein [Zoogloea sp.]
MTDQLFHSDLVPDAYKPLFQNLQLRFPSYEVWIRRENYNRWLSAGLVNPENGRTVTIEIHKGKETHHRGLNESEFREISRHLQADADEPGDIVIKM